MFNKGSTCLMSVSVEGRAVVSSLQVVGGKDQVSSTSTLYLAVIPVAQSEYKTTSEIGC